MIFKRAQYRRGGPRNRLTTVENVAGLLAYLNNPDHPNHLSIKLGGLRYWQCDAFTFGAMIADQAEAYRNKPKGRGKPWGGEIAEHAIYAPPPGSKLTEKNRRDIEEGVAQRLCSDSPAVLAWHIGADGRDELHIVASNFTNGHPPVLRITALRNRHDGDYMMIAREIGEEVITVINQEREIAHEAPVPTLAEIRAKKRQEGGHQSLAELVFRDLGPLDCHDRDDIVSTLRDRGWTVRPTPKNVSLTPPEKSKPRRFPWQTLLDQLAALRDRWIRDMADKDPEFRRDLGAEPDRDQRGPERD